MVTKFAQINTSPEPKRQVIPGEVNRAEMARVKLHTEAIAIMSTPSQEKSPIAPEYAKQQLQAKDELATNKSNNHHVQNMLAGFSLMNPHNDADQAENGTVGSKTTFDPQRTNEVPQVELFDWNKQSVIAR